MPMHDWTKVEAGTYHTFHNRWGGAVMDALNGGLLPKPYLAMTERKVGPLQGDVVALSHSRDDERDPPPQGGTATMLAPQTAYSVSMESDDAVAYAESAYHIAVHQKLGRVVAVVEIVSPGNKSGRRDYDAFVEKSVELLASGIHLLVVDPFPPTARDPHGIPKAILDEFVVSGYEATPKRPLTAASFRAKPRTAYITPFAVGDELPTMPLFLSRDLFINLPLEETYRASWNLLPAAVRNAILAGNA